MTDPAPPPAVAEIYRDHVRAVAGWVRSLGGPKVDLEDLVQEVFTVALQRLPSYRGESKLTTWLFGITRNVVRQRRRRERWPRLFGGSAQEERPSPQPTPLETLEQRQLRELVYRALDQMGERYRTVFVLFEIEELPGAEIAERMEITEPVLWVLLHRARAQFAKKLEALESGERE